MIIDKIKIIYKLKSNYKKGVEYLFTEYLDKYPNLYSLNDKLELSIVQMRKINSWQDYYNFKTDDDESTVSFFQGRLNSDHVVDGSFCMLEYNPNKAQLPQVILLYLYQREAIVHRISSLDIAFDLKNTPIQNICFTGHGATSCMNIGTIGNTHTRYLRPNCRDGRIKVYNKEQERKGKVDEELFKGITRVEITLQNMEFLFLKFGKSVGFIEYGVDVPFEVIYAKDIRSDRLEAYKACFDRMKEIIKYFDNVRIYDVSCKVDINSLGLKQWQADLMDAYISAYGYAELNKLFSSMAEATKVKFRSYASAVSNLQMRPLYKGCPMDLFYDLGDLVRKCTPCPFIDESAVITFHKFYDKTLI